VADAMIEAPSSSVISMRKMLESCDNRARSKKRDEKRFHRHAEWPKVADAVIEADKPSFLFVGAHPVVL